jgi:hypothetical protein
MNITARQMKAEAKKNAAARREKLRAEGIAVVSTGVCPCCGQKIVRNLSITGWFQCAGYGAEGFRAAGSKPCSWQVIIPEAE